MTVLMLQLVLMTNSNYDNDDNEKAARTTHALSGALIFRGSEALVPQRATGTSGGPSLSLSIYIYTHTRAFVEYIYIYTYIYLHTY